MFREDEMVPWAQQKASGGGSERTFYNPRIDASSTAMRKLIDLLLAEEMAVKAAVQ